MQCTAEEIAQKNRLEEVYQRSQTATMLSIERAVCGCDYGGNSWTTRRQADDISAALEINPDSVLLELGAGSGWPALQMVKSTGCRATLVDMPKSGLLIAEQRALKDGISDRIATVSADAARLPFEDCSFDLVSHSDLLCCLIEKSSVLSSCRRVIRQGGRMAFTVISITPDLDPKAYRRAIENGPEFIETDTGYNDLLDITGWEIIKREDISLAFAESVMRQLEADELFVEGLKTLFNAGEISARLADWRSKLSAIQDGLLRREYFVAVAR